MYYTGCSYDGETTADNRRFDGQGIYTFANGDTYVGSFSDGRMHGHGTLFFTRERGGGQYRGIWENGRNVSGAFVFADGLVFGSHEETNISSTINDMTTSKDISVDVDKNLPCIKEKTNKNIIGLSSAEEWLYCREGDRRLWAEHLREVMPVLPQQSLLGGVRLPQSLLWEKEFVVATSVAAETKKPATFAQGQPRCLTDIPKEFWKNTQQREEIISVMQLETLPFKGAQGGIGREEAMTDDGGRTAMNLSLRIITPLGADVMKRVIPDAVVPLK